MTAYQILTLCGVPTLVGIIIALIIKRPLEKRVAESEENQKKQEKQNEAIMLGVQALLRDRLLQAYRHYNKQGWADYNDKSNIENIYLQYEALGPNGIMHDMHEKFKQLPEEMIGGINHD